MKVKKGDEVVVIAGKDRGIKGKVIAVDPVANKVVVEGVNRVTKHNRVTTTQRGAKGGGIEHIEAPINASNVMVIDGEGNAVTTPLTNRLIGIDADQLHAVPDVIAVAYGTAKVDAVDAGIRGGFITSLVTHAPMASALLQRA